MPQRLWVRAAQWRSSTRPLRAIGPRPSAHRPDHPTIRQRLWVRGVRSRREPRPSACPSIIRPSTIANVSGTARVKSRPHHLRFFFQKKRKHLEWGDLCPRLYTMSALPPKADIDRVLWDVRFVLRVQLVTATLLVVYRQGFRSPRSSAGVD